MHFAGKVWKSGKEWLVEVGALDVLTQGRTRAEALDLITDAIETVAGFPGFKASIIYTSGDRFLVKANDIQQLVALYLRRQRELSGLTLEEVSRRLGATSPNAYARYEQGRTMPSVAKMDELLRALWPKRDMSIELTDAARPA